MICPKCKVSLDVTETRECSKWGGSVWRRRRCFRCGRRVTTYEITKDNLWAADIGRQAFKAMQTLMDRWSRKHGIEFTDD